MHLLNCPEETTRCQIATGLDGKAEQLVTTILDTGITELVYKATRPGFLPKFTVIEFPPESDLNSFSDKFTLTPDPDYEADGTCFNTASISYCMEITEPDCNLANGE